VDHLERGLGQAVGHRRVLIGRLGEIPAVQQLIAEGDPERGAGLLDDTRRAVGAIRST
jgi:hypothetical protein